MTREELREKLDDDGYDDYVVDIALAQAQPLFEEIEKLKFYINKLEESEQQKVEIIKDLEDKLFKAESGRTYWFDKYSLEMAKSLKLEDKIKILEGAIAHRQKCDDVELDGIQAKLDGKSAEANPFIETKDYIYVDVWLAGYKQQEILDEKLKKISELEKKNFNLNELSRMRQNEISGLQKILDDKDTEIKRLNEDFKERHKDCSICHSTMNYIGKGLYECWKCTEEESRNEIKRLQQRIAQQAMMIGSLEGKIKDLEDTIEHDENVRIEEDKWDALDYYNK